MPIFKVTADKLKKLSALPLDKEKNLQRLLEENLVEVLELRFLASEYVTTNRGRIDTLAVDANGAPVIIEYKRNQNDNVINQSLSYLKWLKTQKPGFFEKLMIDKLGQAVANSIQLDWNHPRVICIAESYSKFDIDTVEVVPLRIELFKYRYYADDIFSLEPVTLTDTATEQTGPAVGKSNAESPAAKGSAEEGPSVAKLREKGSSQVRDLFDALEERIRALDEAVEEVPTNYYVAFRLAKNFAEVHIRRDRIRFLLRPIEYNDPRHMIEKVPDGYNWTLDRQVYLNSADDLDYVFGLIEQSYKNVL
jgi:predicted transport protein